MTIKDFIAELISFILGLITGGGTCYLFKKNIFKKNIDGEQEVNQDQRDGSQQLNNAQISAGRDVHIGNKREALNNPSIDGGYERSDKQEMLIKCLKKIDGDFEESYYLEAERYKRNNSPQEAATLYIRSFGNTIEKLKEKNHNNVAKALEDKMNELYDWSNGKNPNTNFNIIIEKIEDILRRYIRNKS